jgi:hypothetical protein
MNSLHSVKVLSTSHMHNTAARSPQPPPFLPLLPPPPATSSGHSPGGAAAARFRGAAAPAPASTVAVPLDNDGQGIPSVGFICRECSGGLGSIWAQMGLSGPQSCAASCIVVHRSVVPSVVLWHEGSTTEVLAWRWWSLVENGPLAWTL